MDKVRMRVGMRTGSWVFPNAAVFVIYVNASAAQNILDAAKRLRETLPASIAKYLVCEVSD